MFSMLKTAALSAMIGLGAIAAMPAAAQAEGVYLNYGGGHDSGVGIGVQFGDYDRYDYRDYRRDRRHYPRLHARAARSTRPSASACAAPAWSMSTAARSRSSAASMATASA